MKMYEKLGMSTEDALKWAQECAKRNCRECPAYKTQKFGDAATKCACRYLLSDAPELPKIPRWKTARTQEDFDKLCDDFVTACKARGDCDLCKYKKLIWSADCLHAYLSEPVEAPESEGIENNLEELQVGDEVESVISGSNGVVVDCHVPNIDGEDKYTVVFASEIADCSRRILVKTGKHYSTFAEYLREARNV